MTGIPPTGLFLSLAAASGLACTALVSREIQEVNKKISPALHISYFFLYPAKMRHIKNMYKRLYPTGRLDQWRVLLQVAMFVFFALGAVVSR
jgi:hypothetical protein